ncbi:MAG: S41 family peptidase, partial [Alistipes sp.]
ILLTVDHKSVAQIIAERWDQTPASNDPTKLRDIAQGLLRSNAEQIAVTYLRNGVEHSGVLKTYPPQKIAFNGAPKSSFRELTDQIAYLYMGTLKRTDCETLFDKIRSTQGLIIDLRCYPSDFSTLYTIGDNLLISKPTCFYKVGVGSGIHPGLFTFRDAHKIGFYNLFPYKGKIVILVNEQTQSAAEFMALALRVAPNAVVMGSTTAGADGDVSLIELPGKIITYISGVGIYDPTGGETQRVGIVPDRVVKPTLDGIKAGRDEVLEQAIAWIEA